MNQINTEREQRFIDLAAGLADDFADRAARTTKKLLSLMRTTPACGRAGYTILTIPEKFGGLGASMLERLKAQERLAMGCGPTALAINMHFNVLGLLIDLERKFHAPNVTAMLNRIAKERLIFGGSGSEPDNAVINLRPRTTARRRGRAAGRSTAARFSARRVSRSTCSSARRRGKTRRRARPSSRSSFRRARRPDSVFKDDWNTMGMRSTESRSSEYKDAFVPEASVVLQRGVSKSGRVTKVFAKAPFAIGAVYIGIAAAARNFVVDFMRDRPRFPLKHPMSHLPSVYNKVGEMDMLIEGARAVMWKAADEMNRDEPVSWSRKAVAARMIAIENSVKVVDLALRAVGGASYFKRLPWSVCIATCAPACTIRSTPTRASNSSARARSACR